MFDGILDRRYSVSQKPAAPVSLVRGHPLVDGASVVYPLIEGGGLPRNAAPNCRWDISTMGGAVWGADGQGVGVVFTDGSTSTMSAPVGQLDGLTSGTSLTVSMRFRLTALTTSVRRAFFGIGTGNFGDAAVVQVYTTTGANVYVDIPWVVGIISDVAITWSNYINIESVLTVRRAGSDWRLWINDTEIASATDSSAFNTSLSHLAMVGYWGGNTSYSPGMIVRDLIITRQPWTREMHNARCHNWYDYLAPQASVFTGTSPPPPPPSTYIGARFQMIGSGIQQFSGGRAA